MRCTGIHGMIRRRNSGSGRCHKKEYVINLENNRMTTYRYRMHPGKILGKTNSGAGTGTPMTAEKQYACLEIGQMNLYSGTAGF